MGGSKAGKFDTISPDHVNREDSETGWPAWVRRLVSAGLAFHLAALLIGALAAPPASQLEQGLHPFFAPYLQFTDQNHAYRYYAPEPGPTPVATATIHYADGRPDETVRLPDRGTRPRLRYQRQLALANHLVVDFQTAQAVTGDGGRSRWARSYARHLARSRPGCATVTLFYQEHLIPNSEHVREELASSRRPRVDLDAEEFFTAPVRIGEFPCDAF